MNIVFLSLFPNPGMPFRFNFLFLLSLAAVSSSQNFSFTYNGFDPASNITLDGLASVTTNGILKLTNRTQFASGHAFYNHSVRFKEKDTVFSFSTVFVFAIRPRLQNVGDHGFAFVVSPTRGRPGAKHSSFLGLFNDSNNGNTSNHVFAVELDTVRTKRFVDIDSNHVGIDINDLKSVNSIPAGYFPDENSGFLNMSLISGDPMIVWVDYNGSTNQIAVTMAPAGSGKPRKPTLSTVYDLSEVFNESMYIGFSSSTGAVPSEHYVLGWSFKINGEAEHLSVSRLPKLPRFRPKRVSKFYIYGVPVIVISIFFVVLLILIYARIQKRKFAEELEDWESTYGSHRFKFKDLYYATEGFKDTNLLGTGGFGRVYRGLLPISKIEVAVKRISHGSKQGMKEFVAEISSIGHMSHRNLVSLLGYCRREGELLLVYDYMPNGSLDKYLHHSPEAHLDWSRRFQVLRGVASALLYLHEEWEHVVVHRDVKSSNVLLDGQWNGRLGDFGLARLSSHGSNSHTTGVAGTLGYLAPEVSMTGRAGTSTDVFAFGVLLHEVACGKRPIEDPGDGRESVTLADWVFGFWIRGDILGAKDPNLGSDFIKEEVELVLKLGLFCSHPDPKERPRMSQVVRYLQGDWPLPGLPTLEVCTNRLLHSNQGGLIDLSNSYASSRSEG